MNCGLEQVKTALANALTSAGAPALTAFAPGWAERYRQPVVAVGLRTGESCGAGFGSYLGQQMDPGSGEIREIYGMKLDLTLSVDIYSPPETGAEGCDSTLEALHQVLLGGLPSGVKPTELKWEETVWDETVSMFLRKGSLSCGAYFTAAVSEEGALLSDFILKGVVTK